MNRTRIVLLGLLLSLASGFVVAEDLTVFTEEFRPFSFSEDGKVMGVSTEVVEAVMKRAGVDYVLKIAPWARSYEEAQKKPYRLIYSISRQEKREGLFKWVGIIVPAVQSVYATHDRPDITVNHLDDLKKYRIGTTIEDARETYLVSRGFEVKDFDRIAGDGSSLRNYRKLKAGRIDLWPIPDAVAAYVARQAGDDRDKVLRKVIELEEISSGGYYLAASLTTPDEMIKTLSDSLEAFKETPEYSAILKRWGM